MTFSESEMHVVALAGPVWLKLLRAKEDAILNKIYGAFRNGELEHTAALSEFCTIRSQIEEITRALRAHDKGVS